MFELNIQDDPDLSEEPPNTCYHSRHPVLIRYIFLIKQKQKMKNEKKR